jgi:nitrate/nitrite-specific signal transduction histidine kinase
MLETTTSQFKLEESMHKIERLEQEIHELREAGQALFQKNEHLTALHETSLSLIDHLDKEELLEAILYRAARLNGTENGYIYLLEPGDTEMQMRVVMGFFKGNWGDA